MKVCVFIAVLVCGLATAWAVVVTDTDTKHQIIAEKLRYLLRDPFHAPHDGSTAAPRYTTAKPAHPVTTHKHHPHRTTQEPTKRPPKHHNHLHKHQLLTDKNTFFGKVRHFSGEIDPHANKGGNKPHSHHVIIEHVHKPHPHKPHKPHKPHPHKPRPTKAPHKPHKPRPTKAPHKPHVHKPKPTKAPHKPKPTFNKPHFRETTTTTTKAPQKPPNNGLCEMAGVKCKRCEQCEPAGFCILRGNKPTGVCICQYGFTGRHSFFQKRPAKMDNIIRAKTCDVPCVYGPFFPNDNCVGVNPLMFPRMAH